MPRLNPILSEENIKNWHIKTYGILDKIET